MTVIKEREIDGGIKRWSFYCPACELDHTVSNSWKFNGDFDKPTFSPSILVQWEYGVPTVKRRCHSFVTDGKIKYLGDCTHEMKGTTVELPEYPEFPREKSSKDYWKKDEKII